MGELTSAEGSLELAAAALLLVLGFRMVRPSGLGPWLAFGTYAAALAAQVLGGAGVLPGAVFPAGPALRIAGAVALVGGLVLAGAPSRRRHRAERAAAGQEPVAPRAAADAARPSAAGHAGLALVAAGQLLRGPSEAALIPVGLAVALNAGVALLARGRATSVTSAAPASRGRR